MMKQFKLKLSKKAQAKSSTSEHEQADRSSHQKSDTQNFLRFSEQLFGIRKPFFLRRKQLQTPKYAFRIHNPHKLFQEPGGLVKFNLVGNNWIEPQANKPIAVLWGFNHWKPGFVSDYLPEFRTAFAPRKFLGSLAIAAVQAFPVKPAVFIVWGYTESAWLKAYAAMNQIPIWRMEDGFLRSAELGANYATPFSLVLDKKGLYYNAGQRSDLEDLLNYYNFAEDLALLESAERCLAMMLKYHLSKYNEPFTNQSSLFSLKFRKRVAVLGQVDHDAAVRMGNPARWKMENMVRLAKYENPGAEIIYRPHPETYKKFLKDGSLRRRIEQVAQIVSPDIPLPEFLDSVDHVYTISSLSGLEAILRDIQVTVLGTPFYAGWGLTDDRATLPRRNRTLSKIELFAAAYLKYPLYLADLDDPEMGFMAACLHIHADREIYYHEMIARTKIHSLESAEFVAQSEYWPKLFFGKDAQTAGAKPYVANYLEQINFGQILSNSPGKAFQAAFLYAMCGVLEENKIRSQFLTLIRKYIDSDIFNRLLCDLAVYRPGSYVLRHLSWLLEQNGEDQVAREILHKALKEEAANNENEGLENTISKSHSLINKVDVESQSELIENYIADYNFDEAKRLILQLLLLGHTDANLINQLAKIAEMQLDNDSARRLARLSQQINLDAHNKESILQELKSNKISGPEDVDEFLDLIILCTILRPDTVEDTGISLLRQYPDYIDTEKYAKLIPLLLRFTQEYTLQKAKGYLAINHADKAVKILEAMAHSNEPSAQNSVVYSQALSSLGYVDKARKRMDAIRKVSPSSLVYRESLRLCVLAGDYHAGLQLIEEAEAQKIDLGETWPRKIYLGCGLLKKAFECYTINTNAICKAFYKEKYYDYSLPSSARNSILVLSIFGPGDEIRFASIYNLLKAHLPHEHVQVACDPRLYNLFSTSFPQLEFVPVRRLRGPNWRYEVEQYNQLPCNDLVRFMDNVGFQAAENVEQVAMVTDFLSLCLPDYNAFPGTPYLHCDEVKVAAIASQLPEKGLKRVGLSWRSGLTTQARNEHYLSIEKLEPIFQIEGIQFVNLQYDNCAQELAWVEERYPEKLINLDEIDQYNDFDSVAALMKCLDLIIAPATTVVELAGAIGCPTWLLSNSSELHWRKSNEAGTDVWHNYITHVEGDELGNKMSLVQALHQKLESYTFESAEAILESRPVLDSKNSNQLEQVPAQ